MDDIIALQFMIIFGLNPGYDSVRNADIATDPEVLVARLWQQACEQTHKEYNIYASGVITKVRVAYAKDKGCPEDGEIAVMVTGNSNPMFVPPGMLRFYKDTVHQTAVMVKEWLKQERVQLVFTPVFDHYYMVDDDD